MPEATPSQDDSLQFDRADFGAQAEMQCALCSAAIQGEYHTVNGNTVCWNCRTSLQTERDSGSPLARWLRASAFGAAAALVGCVIYYAVSALTGYEFGLIAILAGWLVGKAVSRGSGGRGGWKYQTLAILLTYSSIAASNIPQAYQAVTKSIADDKQKDQAPVAAQQPVALSDMVALPVFFGLLFVICLAAPFLAGIDNIMGLIIIGIGLYEAWRQNKRVPLEILGPFRVGAS
ncbi:MAG: hypothetical protein FJW20_23250 [Acidimicrobiia bacterium]|nr:hypothetical protein [Acidimicrobiia bacterium]